MTPSYQTFTSRWYADILDAKLVIVYTPRAGYRVRVRVLLYASRPVSVLGVDKLTWSILCPREAQGLVESLSHVGSVEQFDRHAVRVDSDRALYSRRCAGTTFKLFVGVEQAMSTQIVPVAYPPFERLPAATRERTMNTLEGQQQRSNRSRRLQEND